MLLFATINERLEAPPGVEVASFGRAVPVDRGGTRGTLFVQSRDAWHATKVDPVLALGH